ncbi:hypothetical protein NECAME_14362 [Necator americanus]|uniref:Uncharacterized protein n=1 Tax=Necator americanus TaxID=51031 RepID=W2SN06_NECAM|nr:hypothetical protein NECAME_14362 [Necator americanus]ETN71074.1 hypothetical protein NECAME_14362 [Necator americanus]
MVTLLKKAVNVPAQLLAYPRGRFQIQEVKKEKLVLDLDSISVEASITTPGRSCENRMSDSRNASIDEKIRSSDV